MKINPKSEKGAITLVVIVAMLFLTAFLMSLYIGIANKARTSAETTKQIAEKYNNLDEANTIYDNYFTDTDIIPIYTREHLEKIGSGEQITIGGKIYTFAPDGYYIMKNDIDLGGRYDAVTGTWIASSEDEWVPLPGTDKEGNQYEFIGVLDGLGHTISGIYINNSENINQGLFGTLEGSVKNLRIVDGYIKGLSNVGPIAGVNEGTIENCYDKGIISPLESNDGKIQVDGLWYESVKDYINGNPLEVTISLSKTEISGEIEDEGTGVGLGELTATLNNATGELNWEVDQEDNIIAISGEGNTKTITAMKAGTAIIKVSYRGVSNSCKVTVTKRPQVTSIIIENDLYDVEVGDGFQLEVTVEPANFNGTLVYESSDESVVTVSESGFVNAIGIGDVSITVSYGSVSDTCHFKVDGYVPDPDEVPERS